MTKIECYFLNILKSALQGKSHGEADDLSLEEWKELFSLASAHNVLPLVYQSVYMVSEVKALPELRSKVRRLVMLQAMKTEEFLRLYRQLSEKDIKPVIVKGMICRNLYPKPDLRLSADEDLWISGEMFRECFVQMQACGLETEATADEQENSHELPLWNKNTMLYIELHKSLFPPESDVYGEWNRFFDAAQERAIESDGVWTLSHTDHLFYLLCHAFKHFIHSGFGIRQVCDIVMFANAYGKEVDWQQVYKNCCEIHAELFAAALFRIGKKYLTFDLEKAAYPTVWQQLEVDEQPMLEDLLSSGVYGGSTMSRKHSSNMTLEAVSSNKQGKKSGLSLKKSLFPSAKSLETRYPYLKKYPYLLPVAWFSRIVKYGKEQMGNANNSAMESLKIGSERVELLRKYKVIK